MVNMNHFAFFLLTATLCILYEGSAVEAATADDVSNLITTLQRNYSRQARPPYNQSNPVTVSIGFLLYSIREFDEASEEFSCIGIVVVSWPDDRLVWNPADHGGLSTLTVDNDIFWSPSINLRNSLDNFERIADKSYWKTKYFSFGYGLFYPGNVFTTYCQVKVEKYPWDTQTCVILFGVIAYDEDEVTLVPNNIIQTLAEFTGDGTWDVESSRYLTSDNDVGVELTMSRKPRFVILNVVLPVIFMFILDVLVFLIPPESGERMSFCLTVLLAITVFLTLVADTMPKSATSIAWFSYYLIGILAVCILNTFAAILNLRLFFKNENDRIPRFLESFINLFKRRIFSSVGRRKVSPSPNDQVPSNDVVSIVNYDNYDVKGNIDDIEGMATESEQQYMQEYNTDTQPLTWKDVSAFLDRVFLLLAFITFAAMTGTFFIAVS